jgi:hypothetical protein
MNLDAEAAGLERLAVGETRAKEWKKVVCALLPNLARTHNFF